MKTNHAARSIALIAGLAIALSGCASNGRSKHAATAAGSPASKKQVEAPSNPEAIADRAGPAAKGPEVKGYTAVEKSALREKALAQLADMTRSDAALLRANALEGLHSAPSRAEPAARALLIDENLGVRFAAAMTIGKLKLSNSAPMVRPLLADRDPSVRAAAIYAMVRNGIPADQTELSSMLMNGDARTRSNAAYILGELGNESAAPMLRDSVKQNPPGQGPSMARLYRLQVAEALVKLGDRTELKSIDAALYPSTRDDFEAAVLAAQIIGELKDKDSARQLVSLIETPVPGTTVPTDPRRGSFLQPRELRLAAAGALAKMGYLGGWYVGDMYINDSEAAVRAQAAFVLAQSTDRKSLNATLERLEKLTGDNSQVVQCSAASGILKVLERNG